MKGLGKINVYVGLSGGIDSAATVVLLKEQGYNVIGVFLIMQDSSLNEDTLNSLDEIKRGVGIEIIMYDVREEFQRKIVNVFIDGCNRGEMLSPCTICNTEIKWRYLLEVANSHGGGLVATGHYCKLKRNNGLQYIAMGKSATKDQSYYMWSLRQSTLEKILFPLGDMTKDEVRTYMSERGWDNLTRKRESMGVCFFNGIRYAEWLAAQGVKIERGDVVASSDGNRRMVVGYHNGYPLYTLAQKKGFIIYDERFKGSAVIDIDTQNNQLIVGDSATLNSDTLYLRDYYFHSIEEVTSSDILSVKVRGIGVNPKGYCKITILSKNKLKVELLDDMAWAATKGQPAIFYIEDRLVGGGVIL